MKSKFITAKELAPILECTERAVRMESMQTRYNFRQFRDKFQKPLRWFRKETIDNLRAQGKYVPEDDED